VGRRFGSKDTLRPAVIEHLGLELKTDPLRRSAHRMRAINAFLLNGGQQIPTHGVRAQAAGPADLQTKPMASFVSAPSVRLWKDSAASSRPGRSVTRSK